MLLGNDMYKYVEHSVTNVTLIVVRMLDFQLREPRLKSSCYCFKTLAVSFTPYCHSSLSCIHKYLAMGRGAHVNKKSSCKNCSMAECFQEKSRWRWNEQVCQGVKRTKQSQGFALSSPKDGIQCYIRKYLYLFHRY